MDSIRNTFHPHTYASYSASKERGSYDEIIFKVSHDGQRAFPDGRALSVLPHPASWTLLADDAKGTLKVQAGTRILTLKLQPGNAPGDETVPFERSAQQVRGRSFVHGLASGGYEHQNSYSDPQVLAAMLYAIVNMTKGAKWE